MKKKFAVLLAGMCLALCACAGGIRMPEGSGGYLWEPVESVESDMGALGFTDVTTREVENDRGVDSAGKVSRISIGGDASFKEGQSFPPDSKVSIDYYGEYSEERQEQDRIREEQEAADRAAKIAAGTFVEGEFIFQVTSDSTVEVIGYQGDGFSVSIPYDAAGLEVTSIGAGAFKDNADVTYVYTYSPLVSIGDSAFENCTGMESFSTGWDLESIGANAFKNCTSLEDIDLEYVKTVGASAFEGCTSLEKVELNDESISIAQGAFANCPELKEAPEVVLASQ